MGFGFNLLFALVLVPLTGVLLIIWLITRKKVFGITLGFIWLGIVGLIFLAASTRLLSGKKEVKREDIYGTYIIDRTKFPGKQADWQYDHFRFEITKQNKFIFYQTEKDKIIKTNDGTVNFLEFDNRPRIVLHVDTPRHHIIEDWPTLYRKGGTFYYVFKSPKFGNVFFTKGKWEPINK